MSSHALDVVTMFDCLSTLTKKLKLTGWTGVNPDQKVVLAWMDQLTKYLPRLRHLKAKASPDFEILNQFLKENGFDPMFTPFDGLGVVSIMDILIEWLKSGDLVDIETYQGTFPGFALRRQDVTGYSDAFGTLLEIETKTHDTLWIYVPYETEELQGIDLVTKAFEILSARHEIDTYIAGAHIPMIDLAIKPSLSFMLGVGAQDRSDSPWYITQAFQQFKFRMNQIGAHMEVSTGMGMEKAIMTRKPEPFIIRRPFIAWITQKGVPQLPIGVMYLDFDSWRVPPEL